MIMREKRSVFIALKLNYDFNRILAGVFKCIRDKKPKGALKKTLSVGISEQLAMERVRERGKSKQGDLGKVEMK